MPEFSSVLLPDGKTKRIFCPDCMSVIFYVDYGSLKLPKSKKNTKGLFGTCILCKHQFRIHSGHPDKR
jgi:hypothetical protein